MLRKTAFLIVILALPTIFSACQNTENATPTAITAPSETLSPQQILTLADVSDDPAETIEEFQPLADYLAARLTDLGIKQGQVVVAPDFDTIVDYLETGQVDLYFDSPYPALTVYERVGARPLLRRWKGGVGEYHTVIVAHKNSEITELDGLMGQIIAFDDPVSTSGYLLPTAYLVGNGYKVVELDNETNPVASGEIGYVFAGDEENVLAWILEGRTIGAAIPSGDFEELETNIQSQLTVLARTSNVPRHIALASPSMDDQLQTRLVELLQSLHQTPEGRAVLETFERTSKFDALPLGPEETMEALQELFTPVR